MPSIRVARAALALIMAPLAFAAPATATTVGGFSTWAGGAFVLSGGRLMLPTFSTENTGDFFSAPPPTTTNLGIQSFALGDRNWRRVSLDQSTAARRVPAIAVRGDTRATAWIGASGLESALLSAGGIRAITTHAASGAVRDFGVAVGAGGTRAVAWSDDTGTHIQVVSSGGVPSASIPLSGATAQTITVTAEDRGGWWVVMVAGERVTATDVNAAEGVSSPIDLASSAAGTGTAGHPLVHRSWLALADGHGGLWVGLSHALLHVTAAARSRVLATSGSLTVADGDGASAVAQDSGRGDVVMRALGVSVGRAMHVRHAGFVIDVAFDAARRVIVLLTGEQHGVVRISETSTAGRALHSQTLPYCRNRQRGQVEASAGLIAVSCAGREFEAENVETGGDELAGRNSLYVLMRTGGKPSVKRYFEGSYAY